LSMMNQLIEQLTIMPTFKHRTKTRTLFEQRCETGCLRLACRTDVDIDVRALQCPNCGAYSGAMDYVHHLGVGCRHCGAYWEPV
jgi:hypothetical protein